MALWLHRWGQNDSPPPPPALGSCLEELQAPAGEGGAFLTFIALVSPPAQPSSSPWLPWLPGPPLTHLARCLPTCARAVWLRRPLRGSEACPSVCQGLVQILPRCPSFAEKLVCLQGDSHTHMVGISWDGRGPTAQWFSSCAVTEPLWGQSWWLEGRASLTGAETLFLEVPFEGTLNKLKRHICNPPT